MDSATNHPDETTAQEPRIVIVDPDDRTRSDRSMVELLRAIGTETATLVRKEAELARQEIVQAVTARLMAAGAAAAAGLMALFVVIGVAVGGGISGAVFWFGVRRVRKRRREKAAAEAARAAQAVVNLIPERWSEALERAAEEGQWKGWLAGAGGVWLLLRLAELKQLRRMNRMLVATGHPAPHLT